MLNLKEIAERIEQPVLCSKEDVADLQQLCDTYPYSQIFPLLYLKALAQNNDIRLDTELEKYACFVADRSVLYHLLHANKAQYSLQITPDDTTRDYVDYSETEALETPIIQLEVSSKKEVREGNIEPTEIIEEKTTLAVEVSEIKTIDEEQTIVIEVVKESSNEEYSSINSEQHVNLINTGQEEVAIEFNLEDDSKKSGHSEISIDAEDDSIDFESQLISQAITSTYSLEKEEEKFALEQQLKKELSSIEIILTEKDTSINSEHVTASVNSNPDLTIESKKSFSNWLNSNKNYVVPETEKPDTNNLISKFITEKPSIKPIEKKFFEGRKENAEFFSPSKKAKQSLDEQQLPVSETLAKIFAAQGNFSKAIYAYQQLMLIIPEKKIFFAVQIEELEKKLNK